MPATFDEKAGTWTLQFYYKDYTGQRKKKFKRGFKLKKDALAWERAFLEKQHADINMPFKSFVDLYFEDMANRLRLSTVENKRFLVNSKITPFFGEMPLSSIEAIDVRNWQNELMNYRDASGKGYAPTYLKTINNQLTAIFNYAVMYYHLQENPCHKAGSMGRKNADEMNIWTYDQFKTFFSVVDDNPTARAAFEVLYFTGLRIGELLALTPSDIDHEAHTLTINKSLQRIKGEDIITEPKTPKSNRVLTLPPFLCDDITAYCTCIYGGISPSERLFPYTKHYFTKQLRKYTKKANLPQIRLHDLRHSHASLLIDMGFSPLLISKRLGHEKVETTLNTYAHLYPNKQEELAGKLEKLKILESK